MTQIIPNLAQISPNYRALFCDLWGCVHDGVKPFPAAVTALQAFRAQGGVVMLLTNAPRPKSAIIQQLDRIGVPRDCYDDIASSGDSAQYALLTGAVGRRVHHIGPMPKDKPFFTDVAQDLAETLSAEPPITLVPLTEAEGIVCTGPTDELTETPEDYRATFLYATTKGLKLLCANPDLVVDYGDQRIYCAGALAQLYDAMGGQSLYFGKPHPPVYDLARRRLAALAADIREDEIICVGDGIDTDILGGQQEGLDTLFLTEGLCAGQFGPAEALDEGLLNPWLAERNRNPTYVMGHLR